MKRSLIYILLPIIFAGTLGASLLLINFRQGLSLSRNIPNLCEQAFGSKFDSKSNLEFVNTFIINKTQPEGDFLIDRDTSEDGTNNLTLFNQYLISDTHSLDDIRFAAIRTINKYDNNEYRETTEFLSDTQKLNDVLRDTSLYMQIWPRLPHDEVDFCLESADGELRYIHHSLNKIEDITSSSEILIEEDSAISMKLPSDIKAGSIDRSFLAMPGSVVKFNFRRPGDPDNKIFVPIDHLVRGDNYMLFKVEQDLYQIVINRDLLLNQEEVTPSDSL